MTRPPEHRDPWRSYEPIALDDLERLDRLVDAELDDFFDRNSHLGAWRDQLRLAALIQGGADHYLRGERGVADLDIALFFAQHPDDKERSYLRRSPSCWDWGRSKFGRHPLDPDSFRGRAVDVMLWVIPDRSSPVDGLVESLMRRRTENATRPDLAHAPVVLLRPQLGSAVWDPPGVPPPVLKTKGHRRPRGLVPT